MDGQPNIGTAACPPTEESVLAEARQAFEELVCFCLGEERTFWEFEKRLLVLLFGLGRVLTRLMLVHRHSRLSLEPYLAMKGYRLGDAYAERKLKTACGEVSYGRAHLIREGGGTGFHPLDVALGLTRDGFSPWVVQFVTRLATRMSYSASRLICKAALGWSPSTEGIEHLVLGLGRQAAPFMQPMGAPPNDGEVLVIEVDGKCPPTATEQELSKRRGKRQHANRAVHCFKMPSLAKSPPTCDAFRRSASAMLVTPMVRSKPIVAFRKAAITSGPERLRIRLASSPIVTSRT